MRFLIFGSGAIGGVIGAQLYRSGHEVSLVNRGEHGRTIARSGLTLERPEGTVRCRIPVVDDLAMYNWNTPTSIVISVQSQHMNAAISTIKSAAPPNSAILCAQNGVTNEIQAARIAQSVYGMWVMCAADRIAPGVVAAHMTPICGVIDLGLYPTGTDCTSLQVSKSLNSAEFSSRSVPDIMRWKFRKLISNLRNAVLALCPVGDDANELGELVQLEGRKCLMAAGIECATDAEVAERYENLHIEYRATARSAFHLDSTSQSLVRKSGSVESNFLNGVVIRLGREHGVPTPANDLVLRLVNQTAARKVGGDQIYAEVLLRALSTANDGLFDSPDLLG
jgi:2-dehydropantoate 2-reductase